LITDKYGETTIPWVCL